MKLLLCFPLILFYVFANTAFAQNNKGIIRGKVVAADGTPSYVTISLKKDSKSTVTDNEGSFSLINLPAINDTIEISSVGARPLSIPVTLSNNEILDLGTIHQEFSYAALQNIEISSYNNKSYKSEYSFFTTKTQTPFLDIPQSVSSITKEVIADKMQYSLKDVASDAAGITNYSGYDEYTIRGFKAENARLINGLRGYNSSYISPLLVNVDRIEIIKGPSATLYGNSDPGGTINLVTKKPLAQNIAEISISGGTWNHYRAEADVTGPVNKNKTFLYRLNAGYDNTNSFRNEMFAKSYEVSPSFSFIPNDKFKLNVDISLSHTNTVLDRGQPGFENDLSLHSTPISLSVSQPGDYLHETDLATNVLLSYKFNKHISFNSGYLNYVTKQAAHEHGLQSYKSPDSVNLYFSEWSYNTVTNTFTNYFTFHFNTGKLAHQLLAGFDYIKSSVELDQQYFENPSFGIGAGIVGTFSLKNPLYQKRDIGTYKLSDYDSDATNVDATIYGTGGGYIQDQVSVNKWKILAGVREELYRSDEDEDSVPDTAENVFLPRFGAVYELKPNVSLYATYNKGFDPFEASASTQVFNTPFKPVISQLMEVGAKGMFFKNRLNTSLSIYQLTLQNVAVNANDISNPDLYIQQGEDRSSGVETEITGNILSNLSVSASYAYCVAKVLKSKIHSMEGTIVENAPRHLSNSWIKYSFKKGTLKNVSIEFGHSQASVRNTLQTGFILPGYFIINGGIRYKIYRINAAINIYNLTNKTYWFGAYNVSNKWPGAPRSFMARIGYSF